MEPSTNNFMIFLAIILFIACLSYRNSYLEKYMNISSYKIPVSLYTTTALLKKYRYIPEVNSLLKKYLNNENYTEKEFKVSLQKIKEINPQDPELISFRVFFDS
jgi:hypothetical protein